MLYENIVETNNISQLLSSIELDLLNVVVFF